MMQSFFKVKEGGSNKMRIKIAEIRLAPGQVGFYDELTNIHLTLTKPYGNVYQGMNTSGLQRSVNSGRLLLVWGSLRPAPISMTEETPVVLPTAEKVKAEPVVEAKEIPAEEPIQLMSIEEEVPVEAETLEVIEEEVVEEAPKASKKKSTSKKKVEKEEE